MADPAVLFAQVRAKMDGVAFVRHAWLTFGGTWGIPGTGYCSTVLQNADSTLVYEVPVPGPYSFGPIPAVSQSQGILGPSYAESVTIAVNNAVAWVLANPFQTFGIAGYSLGGEAAARFYMELLPGGRLAAYAGNFIGGFTFGNPMRIAGHTNPIFGDPANGADAGIATTQMTLLPQHVGLWWDFANIGDMYTRTPKAPSAVGKCMRDVYGLATNVQLHDFIGFVTSMEQSLLTMCGDLGLTLPAAALGGLGLGGGSTLVTSLLGGFPALIPGAIEGGITGLVGWITGAITGKPYEGDLNAMGSDAAMEAAIIGLQFLAQNPPTAPHVSYEGINGFPDSLGPAIGHVNACCAATPARAAA
jgi:hypothetical protein